jgi:hypothetical protein
MGNGCLQALAGLGRPAPTGRCSARGPRRPPSGQPCSATGGASSAAVHACSATGGACSAAAHACSAAGGARSAAVHACSAAGGACAAAERACSARGGACSAGERPCSASEDPCSAPGGKQPGAEETAGNDERKLSLTHTHPGTSRHGMADSATTIARTVSSVQQGVRSQAAGRHSAPRPTGRAVVCLTTSPRSPRRDPIGAVVRGCVTLTS